MTDFKNLEISNIWNFNINEFDNIKDKLKNCNSTINTICHIGGKIKKIQKKW